MSESAFLFLVLAAIYLSECLLWVRRGAVAFVVTFGRRARLVHPSSCLGSHRGGIVMANPLPPLGFITVSETDPLQVPALNPVPAAAPGTPRAGLDVEAIHERVARFREQALPLRILCNGLFGYLFVLSPLLIGMHGILLWWRPLLFGLAVLTGATLFGFWRAHRALYPDDPGDRRRRLTAMLLSPPAAIRARDALSRNLLSGYHPLAIAAALCPQPVFLEYARRVRIDAGAPAGGGQREGLERELDRLVAGTGARLEELSAPPSQCEPNAHSYCPRCHSQYVVPAGACADCGGFPLQPLHPPAGPAAPARN